MSDIERSDVSEGSDPTGTQDVTTGLRALDDIGWPGVSEGGDPGPERTARGSAHDELSPPRPSISEPVEDKSRFSKKMILGIFGVLFLVLLGIGALAYVLVDRADDETTSEPAAVAEPAAAAEQTTATVADGFDRPDDADTLGRAATGQQWETPSGTWGVADQQARVVTRNPNELGRSWAVIELGSGNGSVSATASRMTNGWGLLFRYRGPFNYWMLFGSTDYGTYNLVKVVDGESESVTSGGVGLAPVKNGTKVGVQFQGPTISILLNDQVVGVYKDPALQNATKVGMVVSSGGASTARWDDFTARAAPLSAGVGANGDGG